MTREESQASRTVVLEISNGFVVVRGRLRRLVVDEKKSVEKSIDGVCSDRVSQVRPTRLNRIPRLVRHRLFAENNSGEEKRREVQGDTDKSVRISFRTDEVRQQDCRFEETEMSESIDAGISRRTATLSSR